MTLTTTLIFYVFSKRNNQLNNIINYNNIYFKIIYFETLKHIFLEQNCHD